MHVLCAAELTGVAPRDWSESAVERVLAVADRSPNEHEGRLLAWYHHADRGDFRIAALHLAVVLRAESDLSDHSRDVARCEAAWWLASHPTQAAKARGWLDAAGPLAFDPAIRMRAEAAVLLAEGDVAGATARARAALEALEHRSAGLTRAPFAEAALRSLLRAADRAAGIKEHSATAPQ